MDGESKPKRVRRTRNLTVDEKEQLVAKIRGLLRLSVTDRDIKAMMGKSLKCSKRSIEPYILKARRANNEAAGLTPEDNRGCSMSYWSAKLQESEQTLGGVRKAMADNEKSIAGCEDAELLDVLVRRQDGLRRQAYAEQQFSRDAQREIDKLLGNHAPVKTSSTNLNVEVGTASDEQLAEWCERVGIPRFKEVRILNAPASLANEPQ